MKNVILIFFLVCFVVTAFAQTRSEIKNLVFEAAGIRGIAYCGAIKEMESHQLMNGIEKVAGTSSGAIMACSIGCSRSSSRMW